jgi:hypothetical protein
MTKTAIHGSPKSQAEQDFSRRTLKDTPIVAVFFAVSTLTFMSLPADAVCGSWQPYGDRQGYGYEPARKSQSVLPPQPQDDFMPLGSAVLGATLEAITAARPPAGAPEKITPGNKSPASATTTPQTAPLPTAMPKPKLARQAKAVPPTGATAPAQVPAQAKAAQPPAAMPVQQVNPLAASAPQPVQAAQQSVPMPMPQPAPTPPPNQATVPEEGPIVQPLPTQAQPATQMAPKPPPNQATVPEEGPIVQPLPPQAQPATQMAPKPPPNQATVPEEGPIMMQEVPDASTKSR